MQQSFNLEKDISFLIGDCSLLTNADSVPVKRVFDPKFLDFLDSLSKILLLSSEAKKFSDIISYAFWIRKASLSKLLNDSFFAKEKKIGRGIAFHVAPSNVPINFIVSLTSSLLAGNISIVRVSNKHFDQVDIIVKAIKQLLSLNEFEFIKNYIFIIRYEHNKEINDYFSSKSDVRIVWGGDHTLQEIRKSPLPPRSIELAFPDRYSIALIDSDYLINSNIEDIVDKFYIDTYFTDQNACSSPRIVVWFGTCIDKAKNVFWDAIEKLVEKKYEMQPILAIDKYNQFCNLAASRSNISIVSNTNQVVRVEISDLFSELMDYKMGGGFFFEYSARNLDEIVPLLQKKCQTISYLGIEKNSILDLVISNGVKGVDRIVPMGKTMELRFVWDGFNMIDTMSRYIDML